MNKPAAKEPSMDEILSSIRQIIADDDAAAPSRRPSIQSAAPPMQATPVRPVEALSPDFDDAGSLEDMLDDIEPLALSSSQIVEEDEPAETESFGGGPSFDDILSDTQDETSEPELVDPEDIAFDPAPAPEEDALIADMRAEERAAPPPQPKPAAIETPRSSLPDPTLSNDMAERLLEPATNAAVRSTFSKLTNLSLGTPGMTIEAMVREMMRPMLKEWLDENLPSVVERMVEKEIARISRGE